MAGRMDNSVLRFLLLHGQLCWATRALMLWLLAGFFCFRFRSLRSSFPNVKRLFLSLLLLDISCYDNMSSFHCSMFGMLLGIDREIRRVLPSLFLTNSHRV